MSTFRETYASMSDAELIAIAINRSKTLLPEAATALNDELRRRRITNYEADKRAIEADQAALDRKNDQRAEFLALRNRLRSWALIVVSSGMALTALYKLLMPTPSLPREAAGLMLLVAAGLGLAAAFDLRRSRESFLEHPWWK